jgi:hypothetical protein
MSVEDDGELPRPVPVPGAPPPRSIWRAVANVPLQIYDWILVPIWRIANTPLGLAAVGFALTSLLGAYLTDYWHRREAERDAATREVQLQESQLQQMRDVLNSAVVERMEAADVLIDGLKQKLPSANVDRYWKSYEAARHAMDIAHYRNHLNLEGISDRDGASAAPVTTIFWTYLDSVIEPRFKDLDTCINKLYLAYQDPASTTDSLKKTFNDCETSYRVPDENGPTLYWDQFRGKGPPDELGIAFWVNFEQCLYEFSYELDWHVRLQSKVWEHQREVDALKAETHLLTAYDDTYDYNNPVCRQEHFLKKLAAKLELKCGLPPSVPPNDSKPELKCAHLTYQDDGPGPVARPSLASKKP